MRIMQEKEKQNSYVILKIMHFAEVLMKWTARFTKRWHTKNGSGHGENPRNA